MKEKYVFALLSIACTWVLGTVLGTILLLTQPAVEMNAADWLGSWIGYIFEAGICGSIRLANRLKFDSEKSR